MLTKPSACVGCPMYQDGRGFVPDEIVSGAPVFVLGQNPGEEEENQGRPFVGKTGQVMLSTYFPAAGLVRGENVSIGNVLRCRWQGTNNLPTGKTLAQAIQWCTQRYLRIPPKTKLIVAQGALAVKAVQPHNKYSVTDWRGFLIPGGYDASQSQQAVTGREVEVSEGEQVPKTSKRVNSPRIRRSKNSSGVDGTLDDLKRESASRG